MQSVYQKKSRFVKSRACLESLGNSNRFNAKKMPEGTAWVDFVKFIVLSTRDSVSVGESYKVYKAKGVQLCISNCRV